MCLFRELRAKDLERLKNVVEELRAKEKKGLTKDQKEELAIALKVTEWVEGGTDVRWAVIGSCLLLCCVDAAEGICMRCASDGFERTYCKTFPQS